MVTRYDCFLRELGSMFEELSTNINININNRKNEKSNSIYSV